MMFAPVSCDAVSPAEPAVNVERLFLAHRQQLLRFVQRYTRSLEDAEDVVQNTFIEAMRCAERFAGLSKASTWLFGIALNLARNQMRRNSADLYDAVEEGYFEQIMDLRANPAELCESRQFSARVDALLRSFPPKIRETFDVVVSHDITYEEAAVYLDVPVGTVRSRVSRVRAAVREQFGAHA
ncbi:MULTISPECIES: RNA polymerase sigma factor [Massilia]|uniref:RNA polymerase sigma factor n=2 Tax=Massilia TaxID=149698 RepID=A0ABY4A4B6_9BURK|nr:MULTISPECIES: RNA polymerase sigma factor [Massilia]NHZ41595.1 RNA polymerase sigma factor [Massilia aquatica]UOD29631.1 RNA polymerase sigma factor [Massilia violaceinigra]